LKKFPIIAMTAHALVEERQRCLDAGMDDHVSKPIDPDALFATLMRWAKPRPRQVDSQVPQAPTRTVDDVTLPEIAGVNLADGLNRVAGNRQLYRNLLGQFAAKQGDAAAQISAAFENGDSKLAERIAHTVKGVAGNLAMPEVQSAAQKLEKAIHEGEGSVMLLLDSFATLLVRQARAIEQALQESTPAPPEDVPLSPFDGEVASAAIARLKSLLDANDGDADEAFRSLWSAVAGVVDRPHLDDLSASIGDFDFETARVKLDEIAELCCATRTRQP
jgi:HPt (histidine-containing phosphotransfer) domain-containing protein